MARFQFRLATLLRIRQNVRNQRREQLAEALRAQQQVHAQRTDKQQEIADLRHQAASQIVGTVDIDSLMAGQRYELTLKADLQTLNEQYRLVSEECERRRTALVAADRDVRVLEKLNDRQLAEHNKQNQRLETRELDEIGNRNAALKAQ